MMRCIRTLLPQELPRYEAHLLRLSPPDRRLRFGYPVGDDGVRAHVATLDLARDRILVQMDDDWQVIGAVHVARSVAYALGADTAAEFAFSIDQGWRGRGLARQLFHRAMTWARNRGIRHVFLYYLNGNHAIRALARRFRMTTSVEAGECEATVELLPATPFTLLQEATAERLALLESALYHGRRHSPMALEVPGWSVARP